MITFWPFLLVKTSFSTRVGSRCGLKAFVYQDPADQRLVEWSSLGTTHLKPTHSHSTLACLKKIGKVQVKVVHLFKRVKVIHLQTRTQLLAAVKYLSGVLWVQGLVEITLLSRAAKADGVDALREEDCFLLKLLSNGPIYRGTLTWG